jgi:hypothetical protein
MTFFNLIEPRLAHTLEDMTGTRWLRTRMVPLLVMGTMAHGCDSRPPPPGQGGTGWPGPTSIADVAQLHDPLTDNP